MGYSEFLREFQIMRSFQRAGISIKRVQLMLSAHSVPIPDMSVDLNINTSKDSRGVGEPSLNR